MPNEPPGLTIAFLIAVAAVGVWLLWSYVAAFGTWLDRSSETIRNLMLAICVGAAIFGGWVAYQRSRTDRMRAETDRLRQVTDSFAKAVELLGHEGRSVRLGAIYALERIARQNRDDHWPIMETLTAYVREWSERKRLEVDETESAEVREAKPVSDLKPAPADIQAIFTVLGRRRVDHELDGRPAPRRLNLASAYLVDVAPDPPPQRDFGRANLNSANLSHADLTEANLQKALLFGATLQGASLDEAQLQRAIFYRADLQRARLEGADARGGRFGKADLRKAILNGTDLRGANLREANLRDAYLGEADLSTARGLTQEQLNSAIGDQDTKIPEGLTRPEHWSE